MAEWEYRGMTEWVHDSMSVSPPAEGVAMGDGGLVHQTTFLLQHLHDALVSVLRRWNARGQSSLQCFSSVILTVFFACVHLLRSSCFSIPHHTDNRRIYTCMCMYLHILAFEVCDFVSESSGIIHRTYDTLSLHHHAIMEARSEIIFSKPRSLMDDASATVRGHVRITAYVSECVCECAYVSV